MRAQQEEGRPQGGRGGDRRSGRRERQARRVQAPPAKQRAGTGRSSGTGDALGGVAGGTALASGGPAAAARVASYYPGTSAAYAAGTALGAGSASSRSTGRVGIPKTLTEPWPSDDRASRRPLQAPHAPGNNCASRTSRCGATSLITRSRSRVRPRRWGSARRAAGHGPQVPAACVRPLPMPAAR